MYYLSTNLWQFGNLFAIPKPQQPFLRLSQTLRIGKVVLWGLAKAFDMATEIWARSGCS